MFLQIMIKHNFKKRIEKKILILWWLGVYLHEKNTCHSLLNFFANMLPKLLKLFLTFMKFIVAISLNLNQICEPFESLVIFMT
jgi:hypothetical protein